MEHTEVADTELLTRIADGEQAALRQLTLRHTPWLAARLNRRCGDPDTVASVLQDTFVSAWNQARRYRGDGAVGAWLWGIAIRQLLSRLRRSPAPLPLPWDAVCVASPVTCSAEDELLLAVEHGDLGGALERLSPQLRQALLVTAIDGLSSAEASVLLGIPIGTVKSRVRLAKSQLRTRLMGEIA